MSKTHTFLSHSFPDFDRLWLETAASEKPFDPRVARVKLHNELPNDFDPRRIDRRFYEDDRLTILGIRLFRQEDPIFPAMDSIVREIKEKILATPGIDSVHIDVLVSATGQSLRLLQAGINFLSRIGPMFSGVSNDERGNPNGIFLTGSSGYDAVLAYEDIDTLLEKWYVLSSPSRSPFLIGNSLFGSTYRLEDVEASTPVIKPNTAFVIMPIDPNKPELEDVLGAIKDACNAFSIRAYRADEIEHQDRITNVILEEIKNCEYLIADLTYERPNVYYEIGYAHALNKKPILYRRHGTKLHFDLSVHNVPEYKNATELRELIRRRLEAILGRLPVNT